MPCVGAATLTQSSAQGVLSTPDCQGQGAKGRVGRLHAQADCHPQHHDRPRRESGIPTRYAGGLNERPLLALGPRPSACKARRPASGRGQGRQPPKAVARSRQPWVGRSICKTSGVSRNTASSDRPSARAQCAATMTWNGCKFNMPHASELHLERIEYHISAGAARTRSSLRPLISLRAGPFAKLRAHRAARMRRCV